MMSREFRAGLEQDLPVAPERVWNAVATAAGNLGWLYPMEIEPRVGGTVSRGPSTVIEWEPPHHFVCRYADGTGFSNTLTYLIDERDNGLTRLRMSIHWVHEAVVDDKWDTKADAAGKHVNFYQHSLAQYLTHFDGRPATYVKAGRPQPTSDPGDFAALRGRLGLPGDASVGDVVRLTLDADLGGPRDAVVDYLSDDFLGLRTSDGLYRFFNGSTWNWPIWLGHHLFTDDADQKRATEVWSAWLVEVRP